MKRSNIWLLLLLMSSPFAVGEKRHRTDTEKEGVTLLRACSLTLDLTVHHPRKIKNKFEGYDLGLCLGIIKGVFTSSSNRDFCIDHEGNTEKLVEISVKFMRDHPELLEKDAADIVRWALTDEFPCQPPAQQDSGTDDGGDKNGRRR